MERDIVFFSSESHRGIIYPSQKGKGTGGEVHSESY